MSLTEALLTEASGMRGLEAGSNRVREDYGAGVPTAALYSDDFNRANGALVAPWVTIEGVHSIVSNKVTVGTASPTTSYYDKTFAADQWSEADLDNEQDSAGVIFPSVRIGTGANADLYYYWVGAPGGRPVQINKRVGGVYANLVSGSSPMPTGPFRARLEVQGTTLRAYVNDVLACSVTDTGVATGRPGVLSANGTGGTFDNWRGGDLPYVPATDAFVGYRTFNSTDWLDVAIAEQAGVAFDVYTIVGFVRPAAAQYHTWWSASVGPGTSTPIYLYLRSDNKQELDAGPPGGFSNDSGTAVGADLNQWCLLAVTKPAGSNVMTRFHMLKVNTGVWYHHNATSGSNSGLISPSTAVPAGGSFRLGSNGDGSENWLGDIAAVGFWNSVLTDLQIEALAAGYSGWASAAHAWRLDTTTVLDLVGNSDQLTDNGTVLASGDSPLPTVAVYTDNFNRANGDLGASTGWASGNAPVQITSNHLDINASGCSCRYTGALFPATSHWAEGLMTIQNTQEGSLGPTVRQGIGENSYYAWIRGPNNPPTFEIWRQSLGGYTQVGGLSYPVPAAATGPVRVGIEVDGLTIRGYVEGVLAITWVEDSPGNAPNGTSPGVGGGMFGATNGAVQLDDFRCGPGRYPGPP